MKTNLNFHPCRNNTNICLVGALNWRQKHFKSTNLSNVYLIYIFLWSSILIITCTLRFQIHCVSKKRRVTKKRGFVPPWPNHFACRTFIPGVVCLNSVHCWSHIWLYGGWIPKRLAMAMTWKSSAFLLHCVKSVRIHSHSGPHFPAFRLNMETYFISLCI